MKKLEVIFNLGCIILWGAIFIATLRAAVCYDARHQYFIAGVALIGFIGKIIERREEVRNERGHENN